MVHFELITIFSYLREIKRVLAPGGKDLLHYSNYSASPDKEFTESPGWRNYMHKSLSCHFLARSGLKLLKQTEFDWAVPLPDCLSLVVKA